MAAHHNSQLSCSGPHVQECAVLAAKVEALVQFDGRRQNLHLPQQQCTVFSLFRRHPFSSGHPRSNRYHHLACHRSAIKQAKDSLVKGAKHKMRFLSLCDVIPFSLSLQAESAASVLEAIKGLPGHEAFMDSITRAQAAPGDVHKEEPDKV